MVYLKLNLVLHNVFNKYIQIIIINCYNHMFFQKNIREKIKCSFGIFMNTFNFFNFSIQDFFRKVSFINVTLDGFTQMFRCFLRYLISTEVICPCIYAFETQRGAPINPTLHPVIAKPLDTPFTVITLSFKKGMLPILK